MGDSTRPPLDRDIMAILNRLKREMEDGPKYLPEWADEKAATPNEIVRSALFTARNNRQPRLWFRDEPIVVTGGGEIAYRGEELRQDDELVWFRLLQLAREQALGQTIFFTPYSFLKSIGWRVNNWGYHHLKTCLSRLTATAVHITSHRIGSVVVSLVDGFEYVDPEKYTPLHLWEVRMSPVLSRLFSDHEFTLIDLEQRKALPQGIATKLHSYWASHREPYPVKVETLQKLCGSKSSPKEFNRLLKSALNALVEVGFLERWEIRRGVIVVHRKR